MGVLVITFSLLVFLVTLQPVVGVTHKITEAEYDGLPPLFHLDAYYRCLRMRNGQYCYVTAKLFGQNELYNLIQELSANTKTHYDHTLTRRGVCLQASCAAHLANSTDLTKTIEACLNATMTRDYQLSTRVLDAKCSQSSGNTEFDVTDYAFVAVILVLLGLNGVGSLYGFWSAKGQKSFGGKLLLSFHIKRNWDQLVAPNSNITDPMLRRLKCLSCFKTICTFLVILAHSPLGNLILTNNPDFVESTYDYLLYHILYSGTVLVQTFFLISGFLTAYNMQRGRKHWWMLPKRVLLRWLRLTPPYALITFFVMTWTRHIGDGPMWKTVVTEEAIVCRRDWWLNLLYVQNYVDHSQCMAHAWYLAADMQLSILGLMIFCVWSSPRARKTAIAVTFLVGLVTPPLQMVMQNLDPILIVSPEEYYAKLIEEGSTSTSRIIIVFDWMAVNFFVEDETFNNLYKRGHTNIVCYAMGMGLALLVYHLQESDIGSEKYKKFHLLYVIALPLELLIILLGSMFYRQDVEVPLALKVFYCGAIKPLFGLLLCFQIFFTIVKVERVGRAFLNWDGWAVLARLSYCAYVVHVCIIRTGTAANDELVRVSIYYLLLNFCSVLLASFVLAAPMHLLLEAPVGHVVKLCLDSEKKSSPAPVTVVTDLASSKETVEIKL